MFLRSLQMLYLRATHTGNNFYSSRSLSKLRQTGAYSTGPEMNHNNSSCTVVKTQIVFLARCHCLLHRRVEELLS